MNKRLYIGLLCITIIFNFTLTGCSLGKLSTRDADEERFGNGSKLSDFSGDSSDGESVKGQVSDMTWASLQELYSQLLGLRDSAKEMYENGTVKDNAEIEEALKSADELIKQIGDVDRTSVTEENAQNLIDAMVSVSDIFGATADALQPRGKDIAAIQNVLLNNIWMDNTYSFYNFDKDGKSLLVKALGEDGEYLKEEIKGDYSLSVTEDDFLSFKINYGDTNIDSIVTGFTGTALELADIKTGDIYMLILFEE